MTEPATEGGTDGLVEQEEFSGSAKTGLSLLSVPQSVVKRRLAEAAAPHFGTEFLTWTTCLWSAMALVLGVFGRHSTAALSLLPALVIVQYVTDLIDGEVGRITRAGLARWGFFTDHLLDYVFLNCLLIGFFYALGADGICCQFLLFASSGLMAISFLDFGATGDFRTSYFKVGATELRILLLVGLVAAPVLGRSAVRHCLPYTASALMLALVIVGLRVQRRIKGVDQAAAPPG